MRQLVIMPGGFHPFHAGHAALYNKARETFPDADVYVAATDDTSTRPFPFAVKEKLAKLAGVQPGRFVRVKSPFRAEEITQGYDPENTVLIFVRSTKDQDKPPKPSGTKRDGSPAYLQPLSDNPVAMTQHGYMAYLPTVEFAGGLTSATEIRQRWPAMNPKQKQALVMTLYPRTQNNIKLTNSVVKLLDAAMSPVATNEATLVNDPEQGVMIRPDGGMGTWDEESLRSNLARKFTAIVDLLRSKDYRRIYDAIYRSGAMENMMRALAELEQFQKQQGRRPMARGREIEMPPVSESDYIEEKWSAAYKRSINCDNPKGFSQKAHCAGRKK